MRRETETRESRRRYLGDSVISRGRQISVNPRSLARLMPGFHLRAQSKGKFRGNSGCRRSGIVLAVIVVLVGML